MFDNNNENENSNQNNQNSTEKPTEYYYSSGNPNRTNQNYRPFQGDSGSYGSFSGAYSNNSGYSQGNQNIPGNNKKKGGFGKKVVSAIVLGAIFGVTAGAVFTIPAYYANQKLVETKNSIVAMQEQLQNQPSSSTTAAIPLPSTSEAIENRSQAVTTAPTSSVEKIASNCLPSVVSITNTGVQKVQTMWGVYTQDTQSSGSGIIIGENETELLIVTNYHVVSGSKELTVVFSYDEDSENPSVVSAKIKGYEEDKDLAVISVLLADITDDMRSQIKVASIGDSSALALGEQVVAIGNALGYGQSVTTGIISALNREVTVENDNGTPITNKLIQTDAAINPGNSGGALLNMNGELVGINSVKVANSSVEGMGYAIPISDVSSIIDELKLKETRDVVDQDQRGYIGIKGGQDVSSDISEAYGIPVGVYISSVYENSPAAAAGLNKGYIITKFDGQSVKTLTELQTLITYYKAGETVEVIAYVPSAEGYIEKTFTITLGTSSIFGADASSLNPSTESDSQKAQPNQGSVPRDNGGYNDNGNGNENGNDNNSRNYGSLYDFFWPFGSK